MTASGIGTPAIRPIDGPQIPAQIRTCSHSMHASVGQDALHAAIPDVEAGHAHASLERDAGWPAPSHTSAAATRTTLGDPVRGGRGTSRGCGPGSRSGFRSAVSSGDNSSVPSIPYARAYPRRRFSSSDPFARRRDLDATDAVPSRLGLRPRAPSTRRRSTGRDDTSSASRSFGTRALVRARSTPPVLEQRTLIDQRGHPSHRARPGDTRRWRGQMTPPITTSCARSFMRWPTLSNASTPGCADRRRASLASATRSRPAARPARTRFPD